MNYDLKEEIKKALNDFKSIKTIYKQIPNILTTSRLLLAIPINILFFSGDIRNSFIVSCIAFSTDSIDGMSARILHAKSKLGADLDATFDKLLIAGIAIPMIILNPIMLINVLLEGLISIPNIKARKKGQEAKSSIIGKAKTVILSLTILAGYIAALKGIHLNVIESFLAITPAVGMQLATLKGYLKRNKKADKNINETDNEYHINMEMEDKEINIKTKNKDIVYGPATLEELKQLKQELLTSFNQINYQKTKNRFN